MKIESNSVSLFHINLEDLEYLLKATNKTFDLIAISESRILKDRKISKNIDIYNCSVEFTLTESHVIILYTNYLISLEKIFAFINRVS